MKKIFISGIAAMTVAGFAIRKFRKAIVGGIVMGVIVVFAIVNVNLNLQNESTQSTVSFSLAKIKAKTTGIEYIGTTDTGSGTKRLRSADCKCPTGAYGTTFRCHSQGSGENCTAIQQGSNACYPGEVTTPLCEHTFMYWF